MWEILVELPTNPKVEQMLKRLRGVNVNWDELIDARSMYKMLYSLQIIDNLMTPDITSTVRLPDTIYFSTY